MVERTELFTDEIVAALASEHPRAGASCLTPEDFRNETLLCHYAEPGYGVLKEEFLAPAGVQPGRILEMQVTPAVIEMARAGYGVAVLPRWILGARGSLEGLVVPPLSSSGLYRTWYAACDATRRDEPMLASLIHTLGEELRQNGSASGAAEGPRIRLA